MAGRALAAFCLLVTLLQVRAQVDCYSGATCPVGDTNKYVASSARECCLAGLPDQTRGYSTVNDRSDCTVCLVIGFSQTNVTLDEETEQIRIVRVKALTSVSSELGNSDIDFNIQVTPSGASAALGSDLKVNDGSQGTIPFSLTLSQLDEELKLQTLNDTDTGEIEHFVLEVTDLQLSPLEVAPIPVFSGPSLLVTIIDDDIIHVEFEVTEYQLNEDLENLTITFKINKRIPAATHFIVRPMRYKEYDDKYPELLAKYPNLKPYSLNDEYDQAELEDFNSTAIPFTIPRNEIEPDRKVVIRVYDDDLLEPAEEGFRLVLEVDESKTRLTEVTFGRQIALFRIDNTDKIKFGFQDDALTFIDTKTTEDFELPLHVVSGKTEFPIQLSFAIGDRTNATVGVDFDDFSERARVNIEYPNIFQPEASATVTVHGDDIYEGDELIQVIIEYELDLPEPFKPKHANDSTEYGSVVDPPPTGSIELELRNTLIIIKEGLENNSAVLHVPKVVREGDEFYPNITVMHIVNATFRVYSPFGQGTAEKPQDYTFANQNVEFGPTRKWNATSSKVSIATDDLVEPDETFEIEFYASAPPGIDQVMSVSNPNKTITIIDINGATIGFETLTEDVLESAGPASLNVTVKGDQLASNAEVVVRFYTSPGTAQSGLDFVAVDKQLTFTGTREKIEVELPIVDDTMYEQDEMFQAHLELVSSNAKTVAVDPTPATVTIEDDDPPAVKYCTLSSSLILNTFSNPVQMGKDMNISMGCERKLVTSCDPNVDLEIRVDFFKDDFASTKVAIFYEGEEVIMDESLNLTPATSPSNDLLFSTGMMSASVSIPDIGLTVTLNRTQLTIATDNEALDLAGLCGNLTGVLVYPDCTDIVGDGESLDDFIHSFKVKPSDQVLRDERKECGITANDTIISDPLMTVPIHAPGFPSDLNLCYEIHGAADKYFNLVSDECTSVNAYYASAASDSDLNIIQSISVVAVDNAGECHNITIDASSCNGGKRRRRSNGPLSEFEENGVSVRHYDSRVRISVPNCEDNELVMWVVCQNQSLYDYDRNTTIEGVEMIKFEIARGLNLKETSHGLLGQFWNIPITVTEYSGPFVYEPNPGDKYYTVEVHFPMSPVRRFVGYMFDVTWEWKHKHCVYAGDRQGGPAGEVERDGSVIEGIYKDYVISNRFGTQFKYGVFEEGKCL